MVYLGDAKNSCLHKTKCYGMLVTDEHPICSLLQIMYIRLILYIGIEKKFDINYKRKPTLDVWSHIQIQ